VEGINKAHENGEAMGFVGVRLTVMLGIGLIYLRVLGGDLARPRVHCTGNLTWRKSSQFQYF